MRNWECFCDECHYGLWAVRPVGENRWGHCFHVQTKDEAEGLRDLLNELHDKAKRTESADSESRRERLDMKDNDGAAFGGTLDSLVGLDNCLSEINNALNFWYPLESDGCEKTECDARHIRLFQFRDRLEKQLKQNAGTEARGHRVASGALFGSFFVLLLRSLVEPLLVLFLLVNVNIAVMGLDESVSHFNLVTEGNHPCS